MKRSLFLLAATFGLLGLLGAATTTTQEAAAQANCSIVDTYFSDPDGSSGNVLITNYTANNRPNVTIRTNFSGDCAGQQIIFEVWDMKQQNQLVFSTNPVAIPNNTTRAEQRFLIGVDECEANGTCFYSVTTKINSTQGAELDQASSDEIRFAYDDTGGATDAWASSGSLAFSRPNIFDCGFVGGEEGPFYTDPKGNIKSTYTGDNAGVTVKLHAFYGGAACEGAEMQFLIYEDNHIADDTYVHPPGGSGGITYRLDHQYGSIEQQFTVGTLGCDNTPGGEKLDCRYKFIAKLWDDSGNLLAEQDAPVTLSFDNVDRSQVSWTPGPVKQSPFNPGRPCVYAVTNIEILQSTNGLLDKRPIPSDEVIDASFDPYLPMTNGNLFTNPDALVYDDDNRPYVRVVSIVDGCSRQAIPFGPYINNLNPFDSTGWSKLFGYDLEETGGVTAQTVRDFVEVTVIYRVGEGATRSGGTSRPCLHNNNCRVAFVSADQAALIKGGSWQQDMALFFGSFLVAPFASTVFDAANDWFTDFNEDSYHISYDCDGTCDDTTWEVAVQPTAKDEDGNLIILDENPLLGGYLRSIRNSPCYIKPRTTNPNDYGSIKEDCYALLAPLPGLTAIGVPDEQDTNDSRFQDFDLGIWVNRIVTFIIGVIGLAAVVMIVIAGVQYMTTEAIGTKSDAKDRVTQSLIGLVIALGIFVILNTINPELLDVNPDVEEVSFAYNMPETGFEIPNTSIGDIPGDPISGNDPLFAEWARENAPVKSFTDSATGQTYEIRACDKNNLLLKSVLGSGTTYIHHSLTESIDRINSAYQLRLNSGDEYVINSVGGYSCRLTKNASGEAQQPPHISNHAYGIAVDINPNANPYLRSRPQRRADWTDMPQWFVEIWTNEGWGWGGDWNNSVDAMHFSKAGNEGGDTTGELQQ